MISSSDATTMVLWYPMVTLIFLAVKDSLEVVLLDHLCSEHPMNSQNFRKFKFKPTSQTWPLVGPQK